MLASSDSGDVRVYSGECVRLIVTLFDIVDGRFGNSSEIRK